VFATAALGVVSFVSGKANAMNSEKARAQKKMGCQDRPSGGEFSTADELACVM
jgi:hypothetical protein